MKPETKVGLFAVIGLVLLGLSVYLLGNFSFSRGYQLNVKFTDVSGLPKKASVRLNGVEAGKVRDIRVEGGSVVVELAIQEGVDVYKDSVFKIASTSLIGSKFLRIDQGSARAGVFSHGDYANGKTVPAVDDMIAQAMETVNGLASQFNAAGPMGADLQATLANVRELSANLNELVQSLRPNLVAGSNQLSALTAQTNDIMKSLREQEGIIGALLNDTDMKDDIKTGISNLIEVTEDAKNLIGKANRFRVFWDFNAYYDTDARFMQNDIALKIVSPNGYTYYKVGAANLGNKDNTPKDGDYTDTNLIDARMGAYNKYVDASVGLVRGAGGAEVILKPFANVKFLDRLSLRVMGTDFSRNRFINGREFTRANIWYGADFSINRFITLGGGMTDILETNHPYVKFNFKLEDRDIASFFGLATLAKP